MKDKISSSERELISSVCAAVLRILAMSPQYAELEFAIFCIENVASKLHADAQKVHAALAPWDPEVKRITEEPKERNARYQIFKRLPLKK